METTDDNNFEGWMISIILFLIDIPRYHGCSSWRLLLLWYLEPFLLVSMIGSCIVVDSVPMVYLLYTQLLFGVVLLIFCLLYPPLDESAQEFDPYSLEGQMYSKQEFIGKFLCIDIALWMLSWSLFNWKAMPIFIVLSYGSFKLSVVHLLHLQSFWDSYLPELHFPRPPGSSQKKSEQDTPFFNGNAQVSRDSHLLEVQFPRVSPGSSQKKSEQDTPFFNGNAQVSRDSHLLEVQFPRVSPGSSQKKSEQDTPFFNGNTEILGDSHLPEVQFPRVSPGSSQKKFEQDTPFLNGNAQI